LPFTAASIRAILHAVKTIALEIPESLLWQTGESASELRERAQFLLALKLFEISQITSGQAAALCRITRVEFLLKAGQHGVAAADLDEAEGWTETFRPYASLANFPAPAPSSGEVPSI